MSVTDSRSTIRIGVFIPADAQVLDTACVDILGCMSYEYLSLMKDMIPAPILALAPSMQISCTYLYQIYHSLAGIVCGLDDFRGYCC
jgi:hypothetical protein